MNMEYRLQAVGDSAVKIQAAGEVTEYMNAQIRSICNKLEQASISGVIEWVPAYNSVTIYYQPIDISFQRITKKLQEMLTNLSIRTTSSVRTVHVPVCYGEKYGPDLEYVAAYNRLTPDDVVAIHQKPAYLIYMIGFLPGFPYLGGLDKQIATPRRKEPRPSIVKGSVGIAQEQTGVYPVSSPGGWNIIGRSPLQLFNPYNKQAPFLFKNGDRIQFYAISENDYSYIFNLVEAGDFNVSIKEGASDDNN